ncbi:MAG: trypsin-like peptidase domain-containing protein [Verrucomicrobiaceae bacterium]|nr:trypsin-like peptidase domain-containing protein [Verrucomicrobiaceae bacterium]
MKSLFALLLGLLTTAAPLRAATPHPQGEWYEVGWLMAQEASSSFRLFAVQEKDAAGHLSRVLSMLRVKIDGIKSGDMKLLLDGWKDGLAGRAQALSHPTEQKVTLVPAGMRGFLPLSAPVEAALTADSLSARAEQWKKAVVMVQVKTRQGEGHGTGFFISPGLLLTNQHVIENAQSIEVVMEADRSTHRATVVASQEVPDIALLRISHTDHATLPLGDSQKVRDLDDVVLIGYPKFSNLSATVVKGSISATDRTFQGRYPVFQVSIPSYGGNSGGPLLTTDGTVIGVHTFSLTDPNLSQFKMAQRINFILEFIEDHASGKYRRITN